MKQIILLFEPEFTCNHCGKKFSFELGLDYHMEKEHNIKIEDDENI